MIDRFMDNRQATEILRPIRPDTVVTDVRPRTGGQLKQDWFASIGDEGPLVGIAADIRGMI
ncbi:hypothetical protein [Nocardia sp. NPDC057030]|uniref:hypothetical protein n=1 Tax=unclassified Nocardia TaxID=2637762 RepID=UPI0036374370